MLEYRDVMQGILGVPPVMRRLMIKVKVVGAFCGEVGGNGEVIGNWRGNGKPAIAVVIIGGDALQEGSRHVVAVGQFSTFGDGDAAAILKGNVTYMGSTFDDGRSGNDDITAPLGETVAPVFLIVPKPLMDKGGLY